MASAFGTRDRIRNHSSTLDDVAVELRLLVRLIDELRQATSQCHRIQRGSPSAGSLSKSIADVRTKLNLHKPQMASLVEANDRYPGMREVKAQFDRFDSVLNEDINERGYDDGYTARVIYLEKMNYESGTLKGHLEAMIIRLTYDEDDDQPVPGLKVLHAVARDALCSSGDVAGTVGKSDQMTTDINAMTLA